VSTFPRYTLGRCIGCKAVYRWEGVPLVRIARSHCCDLPLAKMYETCSNRHKIQEIDGEWLIPQALKDAEKLMLQKVK